MGNRVINGQAPQITAEDQANLRALLAQNGINLPFNQNMQVLFWDDFKKVMGDVGNGISQAASIGKEIGQHVNTAVNTGSNIWQQVHPDSYNEFGKDIKGAFDDVNNMGNQLGGWDRLDTMGGRMADGKMP